MTYLPEAVDDSDLDNEPGTAVTVNVLGNDRGDLDPSTVNITDPESGEPTKSLTVPGEGVWTVGDDGTITFTPEDGFTGNPTPIDYTVEDVGGNIARATVTVTYVQEESPSPSPTDPPPTPAPSDPAPSDPAPGQPGSPGTPGVPPAGPLADTGADLSVPFGVALGALLVGTALMLVRRRRTHVG